MTQEEKAIAYDKVREKIAVRFGSNVAEEIFSAFEESEDERIRKRLIAMCQHYIECYSLDTHNVDGYKEALAWLEKQGDANKEYWKGYREGKKEILDKYSELEKQGEQKLVDKVEPKFHEGDWAVSDLDKMTRYISEVHNDEYNNYYVIKGDVEMEYDINEYDRLHHLWTIKDAKDGDVLALNGEVFIYAHRKQMYSIAVAHCFVDSADGFYFDGEFLYTENGNSIHPATKEQRDLLFAKMREAGYEWDAEKKELHKLSDTELTEFEQEIGNLMDAAVKDGESLITKSQIKTHSDYLLSIAYKQFVEDACKWIETIPEFNRWYYPIDKNADINSELLIDDFRKKMDK